MSPRAQRVTPSSQSLPPIEGETLDRALSTGEVFDKRGNPCRLNSGLARQAISKLQELMAIHSTRASLEVGMAMGMSTLGILYMLRHNGGRHVAIDPYQLRGRDYADSALGATSEDGWSGIGLEMVRRAGLEALLEFTDEPDYLALPRLLRDGRQFDLILIDGYHTFDYTFVDYFYADLMLREGGLLIFDDAILPMVHRVCRFVETHKAYELLGPEIRDPLNPLFRAKMRWDALRGRRGPRNADPEWGSVLAFQKVRSTKVKPLYFHTAFYPYFRSWWFLKRMRNLVANPFSTRPRATPTPY